MMLRFNKILLALPRMAASGLALTLGLALIVDALLLAAELPLPLNTALGWALLVAAMVGPFVAISFSRTHAILPIALALVACSSDDEPTPDTPFELCMNLTDSEIVVVEATSDRDSNAVILKMTAILTYKPSSSDKPLQCNVQSLEVSTTGADVNERSRWLG